MLLLSYSNSSINIFIKCLVHASSVLLFTDILSEKSHFKLVILWILQKASILNIPLSNLSLALAACHFCLPRCAYASVFKCSPSACSTFYWLKFKVSCGSACCTQVQAHEALILCEIYQKSFLFPWFVPVQHPCCCWAVGRNISAWCMCEIILFHRITLTEKMRVMFMAIPYIWEVITEELPVCISQCKTGLLVIHWSTLHAGDSGTVFPTMRTSTDIFCFMSSPWQTTFELSSHRWSFNRGFQLNLWCHSEGLFYMLA